MAVVRWASVSVAAGRRDVDKLLDHGPAKEPAKQASRLMREIEAPVAGLSEHSGKTCKQVASDVIGTRTVDERKGEIGNVLGFGALAAWLFRTPATDLVAWRRENGGRR